MLADSAAFPSWMLMTSLALALGAAGLFLLGHRRSRKDATAAPPVSVPVAGDAPPAPAPPVAPLPMAPRPKEAERRAGFRRVGNCVEVLVCDQNFKDQARRGWVVDRSRLGVRLSLLEKSANGTILQVRPANAPDTAPWLPVEVRNAQPGDQCWEMGCRFVNEPSWELLLLFG